MPELVLPTSGVADQVVEAKRPATTIAPDAMRNVWPNKSVRGRRVLGQRPGLELAFAGYAPRRSSPVNALGVIARSLNVQQGWGAFEIIQGPGMTTSSTNSGTSVPQAVPTGLAVSVLGIDGSRVAGFADPLYPAAVGRVAFGRRVADNGGSDWTGGSLVIGGWACKVEKDYGGAVGVKVISRVHLFTAGTTTAQPLVAAMTIEVEDANPGDAVASGAQPIQAEACCLVGPYLLVAAGGWLYCYDVRPSSVVGSQPRYLARTNFGGWCWLCEDVNAWASGPVARTDGSIQPAFGYAFATYRGNPATGGFVTDATYLQGSYIRSAVSQVALVFPASDTALSPDRPIRVGQASFFPSGAKPYPHAEDQGDWRPAEYVDGQGRAIICVDAFGPFQSQGLDTLADRQAWTGRVLLGTTNDGFAEPGNPDGNRGYKNLLTVEWPKAMGISRQAFFEAEDVSSRKTNWLGTGWLNDIPYAIDGSILSNTSVGPKSSLAAIRSAQGGIWLGGSFADGAHVRGRLEFTSGSVTTYPEEWTKQLGTHVGRGALAVEVWPQQGVSNVLAVGTRNNTWEGSDGAFASAWLLNARNGTVERHWDFGSSVSARNAAFVRVGESSFAIVTHQIT
jgi:hypothetical protein